MNSNKAERVTARRLKDKEEPTMNDLTIETLIALHDRAGVCVELKNGEIRRMYIEGGNDNE